MEKADVFVFYDDVQYDHHGWRNRNRIKTPRGAEWLTIPIQSRGAAWRDVTVAQVRISWDKNWAASHFGKLRQAYGKAPYFRRYQPMLERWYGSRPELLADFSVDTSIELARELGIERTQFIRSSTLSSAGAKTDRLVSILQKVGATHYISGPAAKEYLEEDKLQAAGISLEWMVYDYPEYPQLHGPFDHHVSVLDLLLTAGPDAACYIWRRAARA